MLEKTMLLRLCAPAALAVAFAPFANAAEPPIKVRSRAS